MAKNEHKKDLHNLSEAYNSIYNETVMGAGLGAGLGAGAMALAAPLLPLLGPVGAGIAALGGAAVPIAAGLGGATGELLTGDEEETVDDPHIKYMGELAQGLAALDDAYMNDEMSDEGKQAWQNFVGLLQSDDRDALDTYIQSDDDKYSRDPSNYPGQPGAQY